MVDDEWSIELSRGFSWWAYRFGQDIEAGPPWEQLGDQLSHVSVRTPALTGSGQPNDIDIQLSHLNSVATGGAFIAAPDGTILHHMSVSLGEEGLAWVPRAMATFSTIALMSLETNAAAYGMSIGKRPIFSRHPHSGIRPFADDILNVPNGLVVPAGQRPSAWDELAEFALAANTVNDGAGYALDTSGEDGLIAEFGFGANESSFLLVQPTKDAATAVEGTLPPPLPDPTYGHGLSVWLLLPRQGAADAPAQAAGLLNQAEASASLAQEFSGPMNFGAWTVWSRPEDDVVAYRMFVPNLLRQYFHPANVALHMAGRAKFASSVLLPDETPMAGAELIELRLRQLEGALSDPDR